MCRPGRISADVNPFHRHRRSTRSLRDQHGCRARDRAIRIQRRVLPRPSPACQRDRTRAPAAPPARLIESRWAARSRADGRSRHDHERRLPHPRRRQESTGWAAAWATWDRLRRSALASMIARRPQLAARHSREQAQRASTGYEDVLSSPLAYCSLISADIFQSSKVEIGTLD